MQLEPQEMGLGVLVTRLKRLIELGDNAPNATELPKLIDRLRLDQVVDEWELLIESGPLSEEAKQRAIELNALRAELKARLTRSNPV